MGSSDQPPSGSSAEEIPDPRPADHRFDELDEIGSGAVGTVYRGHQHDLDRSVAIKEIQGLFEVFADIRREDVVERFVEVARAQSRLSHPGVLEVYELVSDVEYPYLVVEYAPNGSLRRLVEMESDEQPLTTAVKYLVQILHALRAAHDAGVVHGGLKPENVVLDETGNAKLTDFGMTTLVDLSGLSDQVHVGMGDMAYASPEQIQDPTAASVEGDIYSLGIVFYELLTGRVPGRRSPMPSSFFPEIPRELDDVFDRMSMDDPTDRYDSIDDVLEAFYGTDEILELLDRQSGVVFLRDPLEEGELQFNDESSLHEGGSNGGESTDEPAPSRGSESSEPDLPSADDIEGDPSKAPDADELEEKLDEYGELFE
ncbi:MAG: serine/threonine-protein kinase [Bradymonadaceae bacterium]